jgi:hypothetical protein
MQVLRVSEHQEALTSAKSTNSSTTLEDLLGIRDTIKVHRKVDEQTHAGPHLIQRSSSASLLCSIINNDHSGTKKDFVKMFQKSKVSPAESRRFIFQDAKVKEGRRSCELNSIESDKGESDKGESDKEESMEGVLYEDVPSDIIPARVGETDSFITADACIPATASTDSLQMASAHGSMDALDEWTDPEFWEDNVLIEKLNENIYEKEFYDDGKHSGY